jgi:YrhK-like protein
MNATPEIRERGSARSAAKDAASKPSTIHQQKQFFEHHEWWFVALGLIGNSLFFVGSVCFLSKSLETYGIAMFIAGSCFMLVSSAAAAMAEYSRSKTK